MEEKKTKKVRLRCAKTRFYFLLRSSRSSYSSESSPTLSLHHTRSLVARSWVSNCRPVTVETRRVEAEPSANAHDSEYVRVQKR